MSRVRLERNRQKETFHSLATLILPITMMAVPVLDEDDTCDSLYISVCDVAGQKYA